MIAFSILHSIRFVKDRLRSPLLLTDSLVQQLTSFSSAKSEAGSCVIGNGIPKSGTYLLNSILVYLGKWENIRVHINPTDWHTTPDDGEPTVHRCLARYAVKKVRNGQMVAAHMPWSSKLERWMGSETASRRVMHVLMIRDPRDILVSWMNFITDTQGPLHGHTARTHNEATIAKLANDDDRLTYVIGQRKSFLGPGYRPWLSSPHCLAIRFEDLYPEFVSLPEKGMGPTLRRLLHYLEVDPDAIDSRDLYDNVYGKSRTATAEKNKVGQYKRVFKDHHYDLLKQDNFDTILEAYGYES